MFFPGELQGQGSLVGCRLWGRIESDTTEVTYQQQQQQWVMDGSAWCFLPKLSTFFSFKQPHSLLLCSYFVGLDNVQARYPMMITSSKRIRTISYCAARGTLLSVMWQPGWEGSLGENGYVHMRG